MAVAKVTKVELNHFTSYVLHAPHLLPFMSLSHPNDPVERLNCAISSILDPRDSRAFSFKAYVKNRIRQYNLTSYLDANEVINEAYQRAISTIESGKDVQQWQAWLKTTCFNIVRERSRDRKRHPSIDPQSVVIANLQFNQMGHIPERGEEAARVRAAKKRVICLRRALEEYAKLDPDLSLLLQMKLVDQWSWQRIREHLVQQSSDEVPSLSALRKRASRAKTKIRSLYHRIEEEYTEVIVSK